MLSIDDDGDDGDGGGAAEDEEEEEEEDEEEGEDVGIVTSCGDARLRSSSSTLIGKASRSCNSFITAAKQGRPCDFVLTDVVVGIFIVLLEADTAAVTVSGVVTQSTYAVACFTGSYESTPGRTDLHTDTITPTSVCTEARP